MKIEKVKILFDFYEIALGKGKSIGIYDYAIEMLKSLSANPDIDIVVACNGDNLVEIQKINNDIRINIISKAYPSLLKRLYWRLFQAIHVSKEEKVDIYYSPKGFAPGFFKRRKRPFIVLTVHDMIPFYYLENFPNYFGHIENVFIPNSLKLSVSVADKIITMSNYSKQMILKYTKKSEDSQVIVVHRGLDFSVKQQDDFISESYIFAITSNLPHKNKENLIMGYIEYFKTAKEPLRLKVCGITEKDVDIDKKYSEHIDFLGFVTDERKASLFSEALFFMFLPHIEGLGLPPYEALAYSKISIVSDIPVFREGLEDAVYYVDQTNPKAISDAIYTVSSSISEISKDILIKKNYISSKFTWEKCSLQTVSIFKEILDKAKALNDYKNK